MRHTPKSISLDNTIFIIPVYQRLFEWEQSNITTLLKDLKDRFDSTRKNPEDYFVGMLTSTHEMELVDGQQRFTVMMLLGCALKEYENWNKFLICENNIRLSLPSRPLDQEYLEKIVFDCKLNNNDYVNRKMAAGIEVIKAFFDSIDSSLRKKFSDFIFEHLSFFITELPKEYSATDMNQYFERMNCTGKNLEQHEILKVKLIKNLKGDLNKYFVLWNNISDVDQPLIRKRTYKKENEYYFRQRKNNAFCVDFEELLSNDYLNGMKESELNKKKISQVNPVSEKPSKQQNYERENRCVLSFPQLLLNTLYYFLPEECKSNIRIDEFFKPSNILETFAKYLPYEGDNVNCGLIKEFLSNLTKCRLALDICFVRPNEYGYFLDMNLPEGKDSLKNLMMIESMIFVSSSQNTYYKWFKWVVDFVLEAKSVPDANEFYKYLEEMDNEENSTLPQLEDLKFGSGDIKYWFWRLDLHIWLRRDDLFAKKPDLLDVANRYVFTRNRSIEHVAPQTPKSDSNMIWNENEQKDEQIRNSFGNLAMISQSLNSSLQNESYEVKKAHVESFCNKSKTGSIESLKLLMIYNDYSKGWNRDMIKEHGEKMYEILKESYQKDNK